ncbi:hypothetical protein LINPERPRIM_LOCUS17222 [Linum perenne]
MAPEIVVGDRDHPPQPHSKMGPTVTLRFGPRLVVFVADRNLTH